MYDMSLTLPSGRTCIIGASGTEKTTLINLLAGRIHPSTGQVLLGQNGPSLLASEDWYKQIAYIPQEPYIFPLSIADNCRFYAQIGRASCRERVYVTVEDRGCK